MSAPLSVPSTTSEVPSSYPTTAPAGRYAWPHANRAVRKAAAREARLRREQAHRIAHDRMVQFWAGTDSLPQFSARIGLPVWGTVTLGLFMGLMLGAIVGLAVFAAQGAS